MIGERFHFAKSIANADSKIFLAVAMLSLCAAAASAAPRLDLKLKCLGRKSDKTRYHYDYKGDLSASLAKDETAEATVEVFYLIRDRMQHMTSSKSRMVAIITRDQIGPFTFDSSSPQKKALAFSSPSFDNSARKVEKTDLKGAIVARVISEGKVVATISEPKNKQWEMAVSKIPVGDDVVGEAMPTVSASENTLSLESVSSYAYPSGNSTRVSTNIFLNTEWAYRGNYGAPQAFINGELKCRGHSPCHIIDYNVSPDGVDVYGDKIGCVDFTMTIVPKGKGGECVFRCWDKQYPRFDLTPPNHRASVKGDQDTVARFRVCYDKSNGEWVLVVRPPPKYRIDAKGNLVVSGDNEQ